MLYLLILILITFWIFSNIKCFIMYYLIRGCSYWKIFISHVMLKASFVQHVLVNLSWIFCFFKFLYSFFVFSKWSTRTIGQSRLSSVHFRHDFYLLLIKLGLLFHLSYICRTKYRLLQEFYSKLSLKILNCEILSTKSC